MSQRVFLKRTIGLIPLVGIEVGQSIGAGIFALTGLAFSYTGASLFLAFLAASVPVVISMTVLAMLGSAYPISGGTYVYGSRFFSKGAAFLGIWGYLFGALLGMFPLYAITGAKFLIIIFPSLPLIPTAFVLLLIFYITNLFGVKIVMWVQVILVGTMLCALAVFITEGASGIDPGNFTSLFPGKLSGFLTASALLTFTLLGANSAVELGDEIKNPGRNIPLSFLISLPLVIIIYILIAIVITGNIPFSELNDSSLSGLASGFIGGFPFYFFILGGGFLAVSTTLNATYLWGTKSLIVISEDGYFPEKLARVNKRFGTPHFLLTFIFLISTVSLFIGGTRIETFAVFASIGGILIFFPVMGAALRLRSKAPEIYQKATFKLKGIWYYISPITGIVLSIVIILILLVDLASQDEGFIFLGVFLMWMISGSWYIYFKSKNLNTDKN